MISKFERLCLKSICVIRSIDCIVFTGETSDMLETHENISYTNVQRSFKGGRTGSYYVSKHHNIFLLRRAAPAASCADRTSLRTRTTRSHAVL